MIQSGQKQVKLLNKILDMQNTFKSIQQQLFLSNNATKNSSLAKQETLNVYNVQKYIHEEVSGNKIVLFMKGTPSNPICGFSNNVVQILKKYKIKDYQSVNILEDDVIRQGVKQYSDWPTYPQLYVNGEFIGGSDIIKEMEKDGSLKQVLQN